MSAGYRTQFICGEEGLASAEIRARWWEAISRSDNLRVVQQTPEWVVNRQVFTGKLHLCVTRDAQGAIVGVTPLLERPYPLDLRFGKKLLCKMSVGGALLMGNAPVMAPGIAAYEAFFDALALETGLNGIYMLGVPNDSQFGAFLNGLEHRPDSPWFLYRQFPATRYHCIEMPASLEAYVQSLDWRVRRNLKRETRLFERHSEGTLEVLRIERPEQVSLFLEEAGTIAARSWLKHLVGRPLQEPGPRLELLISMAQAGVLRSYLLKCGGTACAYLIGFQLNGIFSAFETAYDSQWAKHSPGKCLIFLIVQDLFAHRTPKTVYFGSGDQEYKRWFANMSGDETTLIVLRNRFSNRLKVAAFRGFFAVAECAKRFKHLRRPMVEKR